MSKEQGVQFGVRAKPGRSALFLACETERYRQAGRLVPALPKTIEELRQEKIVKVVEDGGVSIIGYDLARIGRRRSLDQRQADLINVVGTAAIVGNSFMLKKSNPNDKLAVAIMPEHDESSGRIGLAVHGRWPRQESDSVLSWRATGVMQVVARDLRYSRQSFADLQSWRDFITSDVYASIERKDGVTLQTCELGAGSVDTTAETYNPKAATFYMRSENFYGYDQLLIGLAGAIAMLEPEHLET